MLGCDPLQSGSQHRLPLLGIIIHIFKYAGETNLFFYIKLTSPKQYRNPYYITRGRFINSALFDKSLIKESKK